MGRRRRNGRDGGVRGSDYGWASSRGGVNSICYCMWGVSLAHSCRGSATPTKPCTQHTNAALTLCVSDCMRVCVCVCPSGLPVRHTVKSLCLSSLTLPLSHSLFCLSCCLHLPIPLSPCRSSKEGQVSQPRYLHSTLSISMSTHSSIRPINLSITILAL